MSPSPSRTAAERGAARRGGEGEQGVAIIMAFTSPTTSPHARQHSPHQQANPSLGQAAIALGWILIFLVSSPKAGR